MAKKIEKMGENLIKINKNKGKCWKIGQENGTQKIGKICKNLKKKLWKNLKNCAKKTDKKIAQKLEK